MHVFLEMVEFQTRESGDPKHFWEYADEDFVGFIGKMAASKGGPRDVQTTALKGIRKYKGLSS